MGAIESKLNMLQEVAPRVDIPWLSSLPQTLQAVVVLLGTTVVVQWLRWLIAYRAYFKFFNRMPGPSGKEFSWIWGNVHIVEKMNTPQRIEYFTGLTQKFPKFYRLWLGPFVANLHLNHPDTVRALLKTAEPKPRQYRFAIPWLGEGLLIAGGDKWARSRRLLTPAFHFDILKPYVEVGNRACDILLSKVKKYSEEHGSMEMFSNISLCTLDVILRCAMSYADDIQTQGETHTYVQAVAELTELWGKRSRNPFVYNDFIYRLTKNGRRFHEQCNFVHQIAEHVIKERQKSLEKDGPPKKRYLDFLDILLTAKDDTGAGMTPLEIRSEVDTFMFEGHDTTASAISWTLYSLCEHQDVQRKVQEELDTVMQGRDNDDIQWGDLSQLEYLTQVIKEGMRLHCPVPFISRVLTEKATMDGVDLPEGTVCTINILNVHHNKLVWEDPWKFDPDRFHPDNIKHKDSYAFIPFSAGPRNCIGQHFALNEQKVMLGRLLRRYTFTLDTQYPVVKAMAAVVRTENGMRMFATPRTPAI